MRNLIKTLAVILLLIPASGHSLGIGDIKLYSALNQNLNAEISLVTSPGEKAADIKVKLASVEKFDEAGIPWSYFLSKIKFQPVVKPDGSLVIKLTSKEALKEPFLSMMIEVSWTKGNLYREFTVLVDPPAEYGQTSTAISADDKNVQPAPEVKPYTPPYQASKPGYYSPVAQTQPIWKKTAVAQPGAQKQPVMKKPAVQQAAVQSGTGGKKYGPIRNNETLWSVARRFNKQMGATSAQMAMALLRANPEAFERNNIHGLKPGSVLVIPDKQAVLSISRKQAQTNLNQQTLDWKKGGVAETLAAVTAKKNAAEKEVLAPAPAAVEAPAKPTTQIPKTAAQVVPESAQKAVTAEAEKPQVTAPATVAQASKVKPATAAQSVAPIAATAEKKQATPVPVVDPALQAKIAELEQLKKQMEAAQAALALKEQQLAKQAQIKAQEAAAQQKAIAPAAVVKPTTMETTPPMAPPAAISPVPMTTAPIAAVQEVPVQPVTPVTGVKPAVPAVTPVEPVAVKPPVPVVPVTVPAVIPVAPATPPAIAEKPPVPPVPVTPVKPATPVESVTAVKIPVPVVPVVPPVTPPAPVVPAQPPAVVPFKPTEATKPSAPVTPKTPPAASTFKPVVPATPVQVPEPGSSLVIDSYYLWLGGMAAVMIAVLGWLTWRKRKIEAELNIDRSYFNKIASKAAENKADESKVESVSADTEIFGESSFLSDTDFSFSDFDTFDSDQGEIDPVSEADVYLAYGRYQQAEELMRDAIREQPNRDECKLKLLEIFYASENKASFESYAKELADVGKRGCFDFWEKVIEMGSEICPDSALFAVGMEGFGASDDKSQKSQGEVEKTESPLAIDLTSFEEEAGAKKSEEFMGDFSDFDPTFFDLGDGSAQKQPEEEAQTAASASVGADTKKEAGLKLEKSSAVAEDEFDSFGFGDFQEESAPESTSGAGLSIGKATEAPVDELEAFGLGGLQADAVVDEAVAAAKPAPSVLLDEEFESFDFGDFQADSVKAENEAAKAQIPADEFESFDFGDFQADSVKVESEAAKAQIPADEFESFDFGDFSADSVKAENQAAPKAAVAEEKHESFDFDEFKLDNEVSDAQINAGTAMDKTSLALDEELESFDFSDFGDSAKTENQAGMSVAEEKPALILEDEFDAFDFGDVQADSTKAGNDSDLGVGGVVESSVLGDDLDAFDFSDFETDSSKTVSEKDAGLGADAVGLPLDEEFDSFDFSDFKSDSVKSESEPPIGLATKEDNAVIDSDFDAINFDFETGLDTDVSVGFQEEKMDDFSTDLLADDFGFGEPVFEDMPAPTMQKTSYGIPGLTDMDEWETKLDLARAYIDMSDEESAKQIATEVLEKGSPEQKMVAQALLENLA